MLNRLDDTLVKRAFIVVGQEKPQNESLSAMVLGAPVFDAALVSVIGTLDSKLPVYSYDGLISIYAAHYEAEGMTPDEALAAAVKSVDDKLDFIRDQYGEDGPVIAAKQDADAQVVMHNGELPIEIDGEEWVILTPEALRGVFNSQYADSSCQKIGARA